ncbi:MAG: hypothetical protein IAI49_11380 [Candidatus Eremiobacteraeota bacterium]|nr:hypothetical protein [Candidatus Eremiobacteraeota bacterium]
MMVRGSAYEAVSRRIRGHFQRLHASSQLTAVIDCVFDLPRRTELAFQELCIVDQELVFAREEGHDAFLYYVGRRKDLATNLLGFVEHLGLGEREREYVASRIDAIPAMAD